MARAAIMLLLATASQAAEVATVRVYRFHDMMRGAKFRVFADNKLVGHVARGRYVDITLEPGRRDLRAEDRDQHLVIDAKPGESYFLRAGCGPDSQRAQLCLVPSAQGEAETAKLKAQH